LKFGRSESDVSLVILESSELPTSHLIAPTWIPVLSALIDDSGGFNSRFAFRLSAHWISFERVGTHRLVPSNFVESDAVVSGEYGGSKVQAQSDRILNSIEIEATRCVIATFRLVSSYVDATNDFEGSDVFTGSPYRHSVDGEDGAGTGSVANGPLTVSSSALGGLLLALGAVFFLLRRRKNEQVTASEMHYETEGTEVNLEDGSSEKESDEGDWDEFGAALESAFDDDSVVKQAASTWDDPVFASESDELFQF
jgi:LPXTG-motif cell wall-anchored protein